MTIQQIEKLAKKNKGKTTQDIYNTLTGLKLMKLGIVECIIYVSSNKQCSFIEAKEMVLNSPAWIDKKEEFITEEQTAAFFNASKINTQKIEHIYPSDGTKDSTSM